MIPKKIKEFEREKVFERLRETVKIDIDRFQFEKFCQEVMDIGKKELSSEIEKVIDEVWGDKPSTSEKILLIMDFKKALKQKLLGEGKDETARDI